eukprot:CAMPEP_0198701910 /NCGR_PEP_ID=MMETSP1468-20131203/388457_1 /TAXON_ID=1461545 /ORGANISM="Mantoniella sp, Strain CCMP1436" /LENGTH=155 /DNA_ID=CAMNT_0044460361 /DNA_START=141 /DNA_END=608 /DNA_ORIENTATION=+
MSEDQFLILAPKALVTSLFGGGASPGGGLGVGTLHNDISLALSKGSSGPRKQGELRKLANHVETWKTHDDINFVKSADITHVLDFGDPERAGGDCLRQNELLRYKSNPDEDGAAQEQTDNLVDSVAEEAVAHTLLHGMTKCTTTVAFFEDFEDSG